MPNGKGTIPQWIFHFQGPAMIEILTDPSSFGSEMIIHMFVAVNFIKQRLWCHHPTSRPILPAPRPGLSLHLESRNALVNKFWFPKGSISCCALMSWHTKATSWRLGVLALSFCGGCIGYFFSERPTVLLRPQFVDKKQQLPYETFLVSEEPWENMLCPCFCLQYCARWKQHVKCERYGRAFCTRSSGERGLKWQPPECKSSWMSSQRS